MKRWAMFESADVRAVQQWLDRKEGECFGMKLEAMSSAACQDEVWVTVVISYIEMPDVRP